MERHSDKLSLRQPTGMSTARATGFSKEHVGIFFDFYEKELAAHGYSPSLIFSVDETGLTVVSGSKETTENPRTQRKRQICALTEA